MTDHNPTEKEVFCIICGEMLMPHEASHCGGCLSEIDLDEEDGTLMDDDFDDGCSHE